MQKHPRRLIFPPCRHFKPENLLAEGFKLSACLLQPAINFHSFFISLMLTFFHALLTILSYLPFLCIKAPVVFSCVLAVFAPYFISYPSDRQKQDHPQFCQLLVSQQRH
jgi:hypothetical protein